MDSKPAVHGGLNRRPHRRFTGWAGVALALALTGCAAGRGSSLSVAPPPDPPPIPLRKPPPPEAAGIVGRATAAVTAAPLPSVGMARPGAGLADDPLATYRVRSGDTVYGVSRRLSVPLRSVIDENDLAPPYALRIGQILRIPNPRSHIVAAGETVYGISRQYGFDTSELVRLNGIGPPYTISPGMALILPAGPADAPSVALAAAARPEATNKIDAPVKPAPPPAARLAAIPTPPPRAASKFLWPTDGKLVASYGAKDGGLHNDGINIAAPRGTPVRAAENGVVVYSGNELRGFGNLILIKHADGWVTAYAHTDSFAVRRGDQVRRGQVIAKVGSSGNVSQPQLHFEIRKGAQAVDPMRFLGQRRA